LALSVVSRCSARRPTRSLDRRSERSLAQVLEPQNDGSLLVRFTAAGWLEMAWHLYQWGDKVEVIAPDGLRALVEGYQRPDFDALP